MALVFAQFCECVLLVLFVPDSRLQVKLSPPSSLFTLTCPHFIESLCKGHSLAHPSLYTALCKVGRPSCSVKLFSSEGEAAACKWQRRDLNIHLYPSCLCFWVPGLPGLSSQLPTLTRAPGQRAGLLTSRWVSPCPCALSSPISPTSIGPSLIQRALK